MNDSASLLLATTVLAIGGIGLYMLKGEKDDTHDNEEPPLFDSGSFDAFNFFSDKPSKKTKSKAKQYIVDDDDVSIDTASDVEDDVESEEDEDEDEEDEEEPYTPPRKRKTGNGTRRNKRK